MLVSASIVALRLVRPDRVEPISLCRAAASAEVRTFDVETLVERAVRVVKRRSISQFPNARRAMTVMLVLDAAASVAQTPLPPGPTPLPPGPVVGATAVAMPAERKSREPPSARLAIRAVIRGFIR